MHQRPASTERVRMSYSWAEAGELSAAVGDIPAADR